MRFDFLIHVDFVTWLSIYFAVMLPALILTLVAPLYRLLFLRAGAPFDWANLSPPAFSFAIALSATCSLLLSFCLLQPFSGYTTRRRISPDILPIPLFKYAHSIAVSRRIPIDDQ
ncbi:MAG: hypothetical protein WAK31_11430 [Chthoniobacterales bacterium]